MYKKTGFNERHYNKYWDIFIFLLATYCSINIPLWLVFSYAPIFAIYLMEFVVSSAFALDILFHFWSPCARKKKDSIEQLQETRGYISTWFLLDLLAVPPYLFLIEFSVIPPSLTIFSIFRLLRIVKLAKGVHFKKAWGMREFQSSSFLRLGFLLYWMVLFAHWTACGWVAIRGGGEQSDQVTSYIRALYWSVTTLTTIGYGDITPETNGETIYALFVMVAGAGSYGYLVANIASTLANSDIIRVQFSNKVQKVSAFLKNKNIPDEMYERILDYYDYIWKNDKEYDEVIILDDLPPSLKLEMNIFLHRKLVKKVPILHNASEEIIDKIIHCLLPVVYLKGDIIIKKGEVADKLFLISKGEVAVYDGNVLLNRLEEGAFFGEIALIRGGVRTATVVAEEYCDLYTLDKDSFQAVVKDYPEFAAYLKELATHRGEG